MRQQEALPVHHLVNFVNNKLDMKKPIKELSDLQDGVVIAQLLNKVNPELCDLKPLSV